MNRTGVSLRAGHWADKPVVRMTLPTWFDHPEKPFCYKEDQFKKFCLLKTLMKPLIQSECWWQTHPTLQCKLNQVQNFHNRLLSYSCYRTGITFQQRLMHGVFSNVNGIILFLMIFPHMSLDSKLVPVQ